MLFTSLLIVCSQQAEPSFADYPHQDAIAYDIKLDILPNGKVAGSVKYHFKALAKLDVIYLDRTAHEGFDVHFTHLDGQPLKVESNAYQYQIALPSTANLGDDITFASEFSGWPADGLYRERNYRGDTYFFSDGFPSRTRAWLACEDSNADRAHFSLELTAPAGWSAVGSGKWTTEKLESGGTLSHGQTQSQIPPSLFAFAAGPFARVDEGGDERFLPHFVFPQDAEVAADYLIHHATWMKWMEDKFGAYLYAKFTTVQIPTRWGGMEYPGNVWLSQKIFQYKGGGVGTMAHEFAHMWFGDGVGYAHWEDAWLSEGFASYIGPILHEVIGKANLTDSMRAARSRWLRAKSAHVKPIVDDAFSSSEDFFGRYASNTYQKGAWVLHMLRQEVGDELFFASVRDYYESNKEQAVVTQQLVDSFTEVCERDLNWFFEQWLRRPGCPSLKVFIDAETASIIVDQAVTDYRLSLRVRYLNSEDEEIDQVLEIKGTGKQVFSFKDGAHDLQIDPDVQLLFILEKL
ncbi:MAG: aminopeptidase N [Myxococcota bacterium]|jgi:aminopeptidase N